MQYILRVEIVGNTNMTLGLSIPSYFLDLLRLTTPFLILQTLQQTITQSGDTIF